MKMDIKTKIEELNKQMQSDNAAIEKSTTNILRCQGAIAILQEQLKEQEEKARESDDSKKVPNTD
jgi:peptidoglycan hydrolase CwlO-like protein